MHLAAMTRERNPLRTFCLLAYSGVFHQPAYRGCGNDISEGQSLLYESQCGQEPEQQHQSSDMGPVQQEVPTGYDLRGNPYEYQPVIIQVMDNEG